MSEYGVGGVADFFVFADVHESYTSQESESIVEELFQDHGFSTPEYVLLHGGPDDFEEYQRFRVFEQVAGELDNCPRLLTTPDHKKRLMESDTVSEDDFIYHRIEPSSTVDEVDALSDRLEPGDSIISVTSDYHVPRVESLLDDALESDYLVAGAPYSADEGKYGHKWNSEFIRTFAPQPLKDAHRELRERL